MKKHPSSYRKVCRLRLITIIVVSSILLFAMRISSSSSPAPIHTSPSSAVDGKPQRTHVQQAEDITVEKVENLLVSQDARLGNRLDEEQTVGVTSSQPVSPPAVVAESPSPSQPKQGVSGEPAVAVVAMPSRLVGEDVAREATVQTMHNESRIGEQRWVLHKRVTVVDSECQPSWSAPRPIFTTKSDFDRWKKLDRPFGGCQWSDTAQPNPASVEHPRPEGNLVGPDSESYCNYNGGCSNYQVAYNAAVKADSLGNCGGHPLLEVDHHPDLTCDQRIFVPLHIPEGMFLPHFIDGVLPRLSRVLLNEFGFHHPSTQNKTIPRILLYISDHLSTNETVSLILHMGLEYTPTLPTHCFRKVIWACHTLSIDPMTLQYGQRFVHEALDRNDLQLSSTEVELLQTAIPQKDRNVDVNISETSASGRGLAQDWKTCKKIYASRLSGVANGRKVTKEEELVKFLKAEYGFQIMYGLETMEEWRDATRDACLLMGTHGGALTHLMFLRHENKPYVVELDGYEKYTLFWALAAALRIPYAWMHFYTPLGVDHERVVNMLEHIGQLRDGALK